MSLRTRIFVVFAATILAVTATATAVSIARGADQVDRETFTRQQEAGRDAARALRGLFDNGEQFLTSAADHFESGDFDPEPDPGRIALILDPVLAHNPIFEAIAVVDSTGTAVAVRPPREPMMAVPAPEPVGPILTLGDGPYAAFWSVPIPASALEGAAAFYVLGILDLNVVESILFRSRSVDAEAAFVAGDSLLAFTTPTMFIPEGTSTAPSEGGVLVLAVTQWDLPRGRLVTREAVVGASEVVLVGTGETAAVLRQRLTEDAIMNGLIVAFTGMLLGAWFAGQATRPLARLQMATHRMSAGELQTRVRPEGSAEFRALADDFNDMAKSLQTDRNALLALRGDLERRVEERTDELRRQKEDMELFFYTVSHDIKSPAIAVRGYTDLILEELARARPEPERLRTLLGRVERSGETLERLVREVLRFAHAERAAPVYSAVDLKEVAHAVAAELEPAARRKGLRMTLHGESCWVFSDPERIRHILTNLAENAVKYMPAEPGKRVAIAWRYEGPNRFVLRVSDNGIGIPPDLRPHLFRPFTRHVREASGAEGTGLGLSIVARMAASLGGTATFETREGMGTTFWVRLPDGRPDLDEEGSP